MSLQNIKNKSLCSHIKRIFTPRMLYIIESLARSLARRRELPPPVCALRP